MNVAPPRTAVDTALWGLAVAGALVAQEILWLILTFSWTEAQLAANGSCPLSGNCDNVGPAVFRGVLEGWWPPLIELLVASALQLVLVAVRVSRLAATPKLLMHCYGLAIVCGASVMIVPTAASWLAWIPGGSEDTRVARVLTTTTIFGWISAALFVCATAVAGFLAATQAQQRDAGAAAIRSVAGAEFFT